ncbi:MAG: ATP-binding protein, partial [Polyangiales bacterium]
FGGLAEGLVSRKKVEPNEIDIQISEEITVVSDRTALDIIAKNLLDNAVKYTDSPRKIRVIAVADEKNRVVIEVIDNGIGIDRRYLKRVFHRFYRAEDATVRQRKGTGLGLFVVSALVRQLGGRAVALSDGVGRGTTIRITLPRLPS